MANTYFKYRKTCKHESQLGFPEYTNDYRMSLTAFCGKKAHIQLTISTYSTIEGQFPGVAYIELNDEDIRALINALMERGQVTATGNEQSKFSNTED